MLVQCSFVPYHCYDAGILTGEAFRGPGHDRREKNHWKELLKFETAKD
jgi:hypothetical protein